MGRYWEVHIVFKGASLYNAIYGITGPGPYCSRLGQPGLALGMMDNPFNSRYMTIATVERVILGPVMLVPHEAGGSVACPTG